MRAFVKVNVRSALVVHTYAHRSTTDAGFIFRGLAFCLQMSKERSVKEQNRAKKKKQKQTPEVRVRANVEPHSADNYVFLFWIKSRSRIANDIGYE